METQEGPSYADIVRERQAAARAIRPIQRGPEVIIDEGVAQGPVDFEALNTILQRPMPQFIDPANSAVLYGQQGGTVMTWDPGSETPQPVSPGSSIYRTAQGYVNANGIQVNADGSLFIPPMPAAQVAPLIPTTREYLIQFFEAFHEQAPSEVDLLFINALSLDDKTASKESIANYELPKVQAEDDTIDLPDDGNLTPMQQQLMSEVNHHESMLQEAQHRLRREFQSSHLPSISIAKIKEDFSDFWDVNISGNMELELTSKYDCKLTHVFKEKPTLPERTINVNLGRYKFFFRLSDMAFLKCRPVSFKVERSISNPHPHISNYICWGTQSEAVQDVIIRKDFKTFSTMLFQAINNYNHASTFCSLLRYKIHLGDISDETVVFRSSGSYRNMLLAKLPKGINLSSVYSTDGTYARVLTYRKYMPYLNDYIPGNYFKVSKSVNELLFIPDERDPATDSPVYALVDSDDIARIIEKRGPRLGIDPDGPG